MTIGNIKGLGRFCGAGFVALSLLATACSDDAATTPAGGEGGEGGSSSGTAGSSSGASGTAGTTAGTSGTAGTAGTTAGAAGTTAGTAGESGTAGTTAGTAGESGTAGTSGTTAGTAGEAGTAGTSGTSGGTAGTAGTAGTGGQDSCGPQQGVENATVKDATNPNGALGDLTDFGTMHKSAFVRLDLMATTAKFLVSKSNMTGTCLWGFFAVQPSGVVEEYASIEVVGNGAMAIDDPNHPGSTICPTTDGSTGSGTMPSGAGWIPNDIKPGDKITVSGFVSEFPNNPMTSANCSAVSSEGQRQLKLPDQGCFVSSGTTGTFSPKVFSTAADIAKLSVLDDSDFQHKWGGAAIEITGAFTAKQITSSTETYADAMQAVSKFGNIFLNETELSISNTVAFKNIDNLTTKASYAYPLDTDFTSFNGIYYRGFCTWNLSTTKVCGDIAPPASTCPLD